MDKLTLADQQRVRKMSDERLRAKLVDASHDRNDIELTERGELLDLFAKLFAQSQTHVSVSKQETTAMGDKLPPPGWTGGHTDLDREAFEFEKMKWADEMRKWEAEEGAEMRSGRSVELNRESVIGNGKPSGRSVIGNGRLSGKTARLSLS